MQGNPEVVSTGEIKLSSVEKNVGAPQNSFKRQTSGEDRLFENKGILSDSLGGWVV